jgi:methionine-rich copper-binding protein CopC
MKIAALILALACAAVSLLGATSRAFAHAALRQATPAAGSTIDTVAAMPREVTLSFSDKIEPAFSTIEVTGPGGARVDQGKAQVSGNTMRIGLKADGTGIYRVHWRALSVDTHSSQGSFTFRVGGGR